MWGVKRATSLFDKFRSNVAIQVGRFCCSYYRSFMITSLSDWFKVLTPLFQPIRSDTKAIRGSHVHTFPALCVGYVQLLRVLIDLLLYLVRYYVSYYVQLLRVLIDLPDCLRPY